jgi:hypothetical protein
MCLLFQHSGPEHKRLPEKDKSKRLEDAEDAEELTLWPN